MRFYLIALTMLGMKHVKLRKSRGGHETLRFKIDELVRYARICRVRNIMRPYIEAIVT